ncbi:MAG TPA: type II toxin-antitoxin system Phd/YefM family antitoxin [Anaerolineales bacterium]|nr:type II toxin-antitoxin system Phd/YefM family antitoxin [Anaerolineales bacterium]
MLQKISATEAKNNLGAILDRVRSGDATVVIERYGRPEAVVIGYDHFEILQAVLRKERTEKTWRDLEKRAIAIRERNRDLSEEEVESLADEISRETIARLIAERKAAYKTD